MPEEDEDLHSPNSNIPFHAEERFYEVPRSQKKITVEVLEGEFPDDFASNKILGTIPLEIPERGRPSSDNSPAKIAVQLGLDSNGIVVATSRDIETGVTREVMLERGV